MEKINPNIKGESLNVLRRIAAFLIYYIFLIALGVGIFIGAFYLSKTAVMNLLPALHDGRPVILWLIILLGTWCLALMFGLYLVKPLFSFSKNERDDRVEVTAKDCPELFDIIYNLADEVGTKRPKHVYLTTDVNACVFYDKSFWSIFFPVRKNLEIGLGLFDGTSIEEVKSVLAHEFGHFSQKSMKVGSTVYVTNSILCNLVCSKDWWDILLDKWTMSDTSYFRLFGVMTRFLTKCINHLNGIMYRFVQKAYMGLSREMEFDADNISCSVVGKENFISAMCKIEILRVKDARYHDYITALIQEKKLINNYFSCRNISDGQNVDSGLPMLKYDMLLTKPIDNIQSPSRIEIKNIWDSHPTLKDRLENAAMSACASNTETRIPSRSLISDDLQKRVSDELLNHILTNSGETLSKMDNQQFEKWLEDYIKENFIPESLRAFLGREIIEFDTEDLPIVDGCPINRDNAQILSDYETAKRDMDILNGVKDGSISAEELSYNGVIYKKNNLPVDEHNSYRYRLFVKAKEIDASIYSFLMNVDDEGIRNDVETAYSSIFYVSNYYHKAIADMLSRRDFLYAELSRATRREGIEYISLCATIVEFEQYVRGIIRNGNWDLLRLKVDSEAVYKMLEYAKRAHNKADVISVDEINQLFTIIGDFANMHDYLYVKARKDLVEIIIKITSLDN